MIAAALLFSTHFLQAKLQTHDVKTGSGEKAAAGDIVTVDYVGKLQTGKQFDSSKGKPPFSFQLGEGKVIQGWEQGIPGMKVGGVRHLVIPPNLGYGTRNIQNGLIPPNSTLVFDVSMLYVSKRGVKSTVAIKDTKVGKGDSVKSGDRVEVMYKGMFVNGVVFDTNMKKGEHPFVFNVGQGVIQGFTLGVMGMKPGGKRKVTIPYDLAYGASGQGDSIPPFSPLVFELELVKIDK